MQSFLKKLKNLFAFAVIALGFIAAAPALATEQTSCSGCVQTTPPPPPTVTPINFGVQIGGGAITAGSAGAVFSGTEGFAAVLKKEGYAGTDTVLNAAGNLCGIDCQTGNFSFNGYAGEHIKTSAGALSTTSGTAATAANQATASSFVNFQFMKAPILPTAPAQ